jgi:glycosyltransferase involved in cell wall biosynthesis
VRILFFEPTSDWSGRTQAFLAAGRSLAARGYEVVFASPHGSVLAVGAGHAGLSVMPVDGRIGLGRRVRLLRRALMEHFVEVIFVHAEMDDLAASLAVRLAGRGAIVRRFPAGALPDTGWRTRAARRLAPVTYLLTGIAPEAVPHRETLRDTRLLRGELGIDLPTPFREEAPAVGERASPRLACIASRTARHRVVNVFRAIALVAERHPRVRLSIGGSAARLDELRIHAAALHIAPHVEFHPGAGEADALRSAELAWVVADGDEAAFGCLHAMARGLPVLTEPSPVTEHFVEHGVHGALFPALEPPAMAAAIAVYAAQPAQREVMGRAGRNRVARVFTEREMANGFEQATRFARDHAREHG